MTYSRFLIRFPFQFRNSISGSKLGATFDFDGREGLLREVGGGWLVLRVGEFNDAAEAQAFVPRVWCALVQAAFERGDGLRVCYVGPGGEVPVHRTPQDVEGSTPCIVSTNCEVTFWTAPAVRAEVVMPLESVLHDLTAAATQPCVRALGGPLRTALELHSEFAFANSHRLRLLLAITGLEVLARPRTGSIEKSIVALLQDAYRQTSASDPDARVEGVRFAYRIRCNMVHEATATEYEITQAACLAYEALSAAIRARMRAS